VIPAADREACRALGFAGVFPTGADFDEIADFIRENVK
jgi:methylmalonyl-CoA mutase C-terminal domain/subunit